MTNRSIELADYQIRETAETLEVEHLPSETVWKFPPAGMDDSDRMLRQSDISTTENLGLHESDPSAHHERYTDGEAVSATSGMYADAVHGDEAHSVDYLTSSDVFSGSHDDLTNVSSSDHHDRPLPGLHLSESNGEFNVTGVPEHGNDEHFENYVLFSEYAEHTIATMAHGVSEVAGVEDLYTDADAIAATAGEYASVSHGNESHSTPFLTQADAFSGSHNDLTDVTPDAHHTRYTDEEARAAVGDVTNENALDKTGDTMTGLLTLDPLGVRLQNDEGNFSTLTYSNDLHVDGNRVRHEGNENPFTDYEPIAEPSTPTTGWRAFTDQADGAFKIKSADGEVVTIASRN